MASGEEFDGDEFSNNLFSDLAPLLTLFGEEVTKQFLSMSMGWADNVLLAIGPLGIITIIVSSIRVGGGRRLKALIGRAREPRSIAEQQVLSSTSENVCELWNGQQIVRSIGDTEGAKTLLISDSGAVFDLHSAVHEQLIEIDDDVVQKHAEERLYNPTPNLSLNTRNAITPPVVLWTLAALGILLQLAALTFPGITTYLWRWQKGSTPVASYAYPCFCVGTLCLSLGTMICGHVIEGVTSEHNVTLSEEGKKASVKFFSLQRAQKVGEEQYPTCALFMAQQDHILRTSRLNGRNYGHLATAAMAFAVTGYIVQFVGLRALHWSASVVQLGLTLIMTAVRAWVRRGLASNPEATSAPNLHGHELAWLTLHLTSQTQNASQENCKCKSHASFSGFLWWKKNRSEENLAIKRRRIAAETKKNDVAEESLNSNRPLVFWELISDHSEDVDHFEDMELLQGNSSPLIACAGVVEPTVGASRIHDYSIGVGNGETFRLAERLPKDGFTDYMAPQLYTHPKGPMKVSLEFSSSLLNDISRPTEVSDSLKTKLPSYQASLDPGPLRTYLQLAPHFDGNSANSEVTSASQALCAAIAKVMNVLGTQESVFWKLPAASTFFNSKTPAETHKVHWKIDINFDNRGPRKEFSFPLQRRSNPSSQSAEIDVELYAQIVAALSLSLYTDAARLAIATGLAYSARPQSHSYMLRRFKRIVGHAKSASVSKHQILMQEWLGVQVEILDLRRKRVERRHQRRQKVKDIEEMWNQTHSWTTVEKAWAALLPSVGAGGFSEVGGVGIRETRMANVGRVEVANRLAQIAAMEGSEAYLGMFVSSSSLPHSTNESHGFKELLIHEHDGTSKALQYAQELFSLLLLGLAEHVQRINGATTVTDGESGCGTKRWKNSVFESVAKEVVKAKLAQDVEEAYTLIIPAFAKYNLLPTEPSPQDETASGDSTAPTRAASSEDPTLQGAGVQHSSPPGQSSAPRQDPTPQQPSTQQSATVHQETSREQGSPIHRHPSRQSQCSEPGATQLSEETSAQPTQAVISNLSLVRRASC